MSSLFGKFLTILGLKKREANILVVGLDNSGKSTILNYLKRKEDKVNEVVPTVGFTVEKLSALDKNRSGISLTAYDMSGQGRYRNLWEHYYDNVEGILFVVDSTDALRLVVARDELEMLLKHQNLFSSASNNENSNKKDDESEKKSINNETDTIASTSSSTNGARRDSKQEIPILFFANKMDLKDALPSVKISQTLGLQSFPHDQWHVQASNAITGEGIQEGIDWLIFQIAKNKKLNNNKALTSGNGTNLSTSLSTMSLK